MTLTPELMWLTAVAAMTAVFWMPYAAALMLQTGPVDALMDGEHDMQLDPPWARRAKRAHANAIENLVVFASLVLAVQLADAGNAATALACAVYFFARAVHYVVYTAGVPVARTLSFLAGFACQLTLAIQLARALM